jgi:DNA-binding response OmpR family regulator
MTELRPLLSAKASIEDKVKGFELGGDDYLTKPFAFAELVARIRNLLRRNGPSHAVILKAGDLTLDPLTRTVRRGQQLIPLTNREPLFVCTLSWYSCAFLRVFRLLVRIYPFNFLIDMV